VACALNALKGKEKKDVVVGQPQLWIGMNRTP